MVYDPVRDCEVPSPAVSSPWDNTYQTPGSTYSSYEDSRSSHNDRPQPPAFDNSNSHSPSNGALSISRSAPGGLRGLLNDNKADENPGRGSDRTSYSSAAEEEPYSRRSLSNLLNDSPALPLAKSSSASSFAHDSSPSNTSPGPRPSFLDPNGFLTPAQPTLRSRSDASRSPYPSTSPISGPSHLPQDAHGRYGQYDSGPSRRPEPQLMMPPQEARVHEYDIPRASLPRRSPSVSVSPRSHQQTLPTSRPTSSRSTASHTFSFQPPPLPTSYVSSPSSTSRRLSEDYQRPSSSGRRPQPGHLDAYSPRYSNSLPPPPRQPYNPRRISRPDSVLDPIEPDEIARLKSIGLANNPLRKRKSRPLPSWSAPSPGPRHSLPSEQDTSYFPGQPDSRPGSQRGTTGFVQRRASTSSSTGRPSVALDRHQDGSTSQEQSRADGIHVGNGDKPRKRPSESGGDDNHDERRRKVGDTHYVGNVAAVANHYNARPEVGIQHREFSPIIGLKKFNNWIKSVLIGKFAARRAGGPGACVLDIGCGKGGDLNKWKQAKISLYVGLDIAETSTQQARNRYETMFKPGFEASFFAHDCYSRPISDVLPEQLRIQDLYDNVSMQFCMHYAFETASKARMMMENVSRYLKRGGIFIGTIPDSELLLDRLNQLPEDDESLRFGNSCYYVQFAERNHKGLYGHQYSFFLQDAVEDVPEYLVNWDNFVALALEYRLRLVYKKSFNDVLQDEQSSRDFGPLLGKMGVVNQQGESAMDADQWEAANLYMAFAFEKM